MLKALRHCTCCGKELIRSTKAYCDDTCRKRAARGNTEQQIESRWIIECLRRMQLVGKIPRATIPSAVGRDSPAQRAHRWA